MHVDGTHFRVWAPRSESVRGDLYDDGDTVTTTHPLEAEGSGYFSGLVSGVGSGARYRFRLDHGAFPDPASRSQPDGPHGPSQVVDPKFAWTDAGWTGRPPRELVMY